jgi:ribonuclease III
MNTFDNLIKNAATIESKLGYLFKNRSLLALAFVHRSYVNENKAVAQHNERLEFLGDSILGLIVADHLYRMLPHTPEGELSYLRSRLVEASSCVSYVSKLDLESFILLGKGERLNDGRGRDTILADLFEAIIGAIYLDGGFEITKQFVLSKFSNEFEQILQTPIQNWKALLQDYCQKKHQKAPTYKVINESGPDHSKQFKVIVFLNDIELGHGEGSSKKAAQQSAAENALSKLKS